MLFVHKVHRKKSKNEKKNKGGTLLLGLQTTLEVGSGATE